MSVEIEGKAIADDTIVTWSMRRRDDPEPHWPYEGQGHSTVEILEWKREHHATYYADVDSMRAALTIPASIRIALSGGGLRASLFGLGALLYLVDVDAGY